ncbi:hypothetical protein GGF46_004012 [Coemansia sp. RSA 552]|nr:hypothetical protein GGF46_004012 [Coemansia sp. RSA 552]
MDKIGEFNAGLREILEGPNPPRDKLVGVLQSTQQEFLASAVAAATVSWPSQTYLELVRIVVDQPIREPPPEAVMAAPTTSHESEPFFGAYFFEKLRQLLLSMSLERMAEPDGAWVQNVGFSIEATIIQAIRRMETLEKQEALANQGQGGSPQDLTRIRMYCAHVLGSGTLAMQTWQAIAQMVFSVFYVLPCSTKALFRAPQEEVLPTSDAHLSYMPRLVAHYDRWVQIILRIIEEHGTTLCRWMPTVVEDPATKQFRWGTPMLHSIATVELLRNFIMRRILFTDARPVAGEASCTDEQHLEQLEQKVLNEIISRDPSTVYGMVCEHHHLLQLYLCCAKDPGPLSAVLGTDECLKLSLMRSCYGLAPILGFEEQGLTQGITMDKLVECLASMKHTTVELYYAPVYGSYPQGAAGVPTYTEQLCIRMATSLFNIDQAWDELAGLLSPAKVADISQELSNRLTRGLRVVAAFFDLFSLGTASFTDSGSVDSAMSRLMRYLQPSSESASAPAERIALGIDWVCEFVQSAEGSIAPALVYAHCAASLDRVVACYAARGDQAGLADVLGCIPSPKWKQMAAVRFCSMGSQTGSLFGIFWSCLQRLSSTDGLRGLADGVSSARAWQETMSLCYPHAAFLAYIVSTLCVESARQLVVNDGSGMRVPSLTRPGVDALLVLERTLTGDGLQAWAPRGLLFAPPILAGTDSQQIRDFAQKMLPGAMALLGSGSLADWVSQLGLGPGAGLEFTEDDMRRVACLVSSYVAGLPGTFELLPRLLKVSEAERVQAPFVAPNILSRLPPIGSQSNSDACDVAGAIRQWHRSVAQQPYSQSRKGIQELISECYPSNYRHYLDAVVVGFMESDPVAGVELVIGSLADHMWKQQSVYARKLSPFFGIHGMFSAASLPATPTMSAGPRAANAAQPHRKVVFNAVVGGKVRLQAGSAAAGRIPTTAEQQTKGAAVDGRRSRIDSAEAAEAKVVKHPVACLRILLLLTDLCYGNSMRNTPIHMWLTDCLDHSPTSLLRRYFDSVVGQDAPRFSPELPVEPDWPKKVKATLALWANDSALRVRPLVQMGCLAVMRYVLEDCGKSWPLRWQEWAPAIEGALGRMFSRPRTSYIQAEIVQAMLTVPLADSSPDPKAALQKHPLHLLAASTSPGSDHELLAFANNRDWFLTHVLPCAMGAMADNATARSILGTVLSSPDLLYATVPWLDIAASLVQGVPLSKGCPVAMSPEMAKRHFVGYLSPLARVLFAISAYTDGGDAEGTEDSAGPGASATDGGSDPTVEVSAAAEDDDESDSAADFDWPWLDEQLAVYVSNSSAAGGEVLRDTVNAFLDVYTFTSTPGLRRSIENVIVACCLHDPSITQVVLGRLLEKRPLDVHTLHSLRPRTLSSLPALAPSSADNEASFRPGAEIYPLARRVLLLALGDADPQTVSSVAKAIAQHMWAISEAPDIRHNLIALKPRLIPKDQRPAATETSTSQDLITQTTSGSLHVQAGAIGSAAAYALERSIYLLGLVVTRNQDEPSIKRLSVHLGHSRVLLAVFMISVSESMRQFPTLPAIREILTALWALSDDGSAQVDGIMTSQVWSSINFNVLAQRLHSQTPDEFTAWPIIQTLSAK